MMIKKTKQPMNIAGLMGRDASQPAQMSMQQTVDPLERLNQKMAGRTKGGAMEGLKKRRVSIMNGYGLS